MLKHFVVVCVISSVHVTCRGSIKAEAPTKPPPQPLAENSDCKIITHLCNPSGLSVEKTFVNVTTLRECQHHCARDENQKCKYVTFSNFRNITSCHLLTNCDDKVLPHLHIIYYICLFAKQTCMTLFH